MFQDIALYIETIVPRRISFGAKTVDFSFARVERTEEAVAE
jgi:hypothetical protein